MKNIILNTKTLRFQNPCQQLQSNGFAVFYDKLNLSQNVEPKYCKDCTHVYQDTDLMYQDYNPLTVESPDSSAAAESFNQSVKTA